MPYYDDWGWGMAFYEDGSFDTYDYSEVTDSYPAGTATYSVGHIDLTAWDWCVMDVSSDGKMFVATDGYEYSVGCKAQLVGDLIIPNDGSITTIGFARFSGQSSLTSITIPDSVTSIGDEAFWECINLSNLSIGNGVTSIGPCAFQNCTSLTSVTIPDSVTSIGSSAFSGCTNLTIVTIGNGVTSIGEQAFSLCFSLTSITIPNSITSIGDSVFWRCTNLTNIYFAGTMAQWNAITLGDDWNYDVPATYVQCSDGQLSLIPM